MKINLVVLGILMLLSSSLRGQSIDLGSTDTYPMNVSAQMLVFEDPTGSVEIEEVHQQHFKTLGQPYFIFPFTNSVFWVKLVFTNDSEKNDRWVLNWSNPLIEELVFYEYSENESNYQNRKVWNLANEKDFSLYSTEPGFEFNLIKGEEKVIYLKLESKRGHYGYLNVYSLEGYNDHLLSEFGTQSFLNGLLIFRLLLIVILSFFVIKNRLFRAYSLIIFLKTFGFWGLGNVSGPLFSDDPLAIQKIDFVLYGIMPLCLVVFALRTLPMDKVSHWVAKVGYAILAFAVAVNLIIVVDYQWYWLKAGMVLTVLGGLYTLCLYGYFVFKKLNIHKYYSIPLMLGLTSNLLIIIRLLTHLNFNGIFLIAMILFVAEIVTFILFLGQIFRQIERTKIKVEQSLLTETDQNRRLVELDKLKTSFFTNISHEIRTPLTLMYGPAQELRKKYPEEKMTGLLAENLSKLRNLVDELLDIQKLEAKKMEPKIIRADIVGHLRLLVSSFSSLAESKSISLSFIQKQDTIKGCYDEQMLGKIVNNLLSNALKFTPEEGSVICKADYEESKQMLSFSVSNTGSKIKEEQLTRIFDRFYQVENTSHLGTGVGLALVKDLITVLKGEVSATSNDQETRFHFQLPLAEATWPQQVIEEKEIILEAAKDTVNDTYNEQRPLEEESTELLLLVEDNDDMRSYIKTLLSKSYRIIEAVNGEEGLAMAIKEVPDIIISDAMMPVMDGYEFSNRIKNTLQTSHIPVLMLTAKNSRESKIEGYQHGVDNYLTKPFDTDELSSVLSALQANRKRLREIYAKEVVELKPDEIKVSSKEKQFLNTLNEYLEINFHRSELGVKDLADHIKISDTQLRRKLKSISGYSPNEYLRKFRLKNAAELLGSKSVSEVAYEVGFENLSYFSKVFQAEYGCLPSEYPLQKA